MERIALQKLLAWNNDPRKKPLIVWRGRTSAELEFIVESDNKLYPIDVKIGSILFRGYTADLLYQYIIALNNINYFKHCICSLLNITHQ